MSSPHLLCPLVSISVCGLVTVSSSCPNAAVTLPKPKVINIPLDVHYFAGDDHDKRPAPNFCCPWTELSIRWVHQTNVVVAGVACKDVGKESSCLLLLWWGKNGSIFCPHHRHQPPLIAAKSRRASPQLDWQFNLVVSSDIVIWLNDHPLKIPFLVLIYQWI